MPGDSKQSKTKDLSHVPCKFFKVGSCTAGASCPFAHPTTDTGAPPSKEPCAWFIKGNCKFGHKCALAHILPGQPISMDRKNKKAAQIASQAAAAAANDSGFPAMGGGARSTAGRRGPNKTPLLSMMPGGIGGTAPTRALKASPSAPAPTLSGSGDFDERTPMEARQSPLVNGVGSNETLETQASEQQQHNPPAKTPPQNLPAASQKQPETGAISLAVNIDQQINSPSSPLPLNTPRRPRPTTAGTGSFGPIGSPPNNPSLSTSPHSHGLFLAQRAVSSTLPGGGMIRPRHLASPHHHAHSTSHSFVTDDMEERQNDRDRDREAELLPSSLTDLLPPRHQHQRMDGLGMALEGLHQTGFLKDELSGGIGHRYSHSVPAPSLLSGDKLRSIWAPDPAPYPPPGPSMSATHRTNGSTSATATSPFSSQPGSFTGTPSISSHFNNNSSMSTTPTHGFISPSNASAAFLPGMHQNYRPPQTNGLSNHLNSNTTSQQHQQSSNNYSRAFSPPSMRTLAFNEHAPGSSLPQGLAAGYSRIHALPPAPSAFSPPYNSPPSHNTTNTTSASPFGAPPGLTRERDRGAAFSPPKQQQGQGLETMFSRLSYATATASRSGPGAGPSPRKEGPLSPLSRPGAVVKEGPEDDELFVLD